MRRHGTDDSRIPTGHSHVRASTVGPSLALPIVDGLVPLGTWQQIVLIDFDTRPRNRTVHLSVIGIGRP